MSCIIYGYCRVHFSCRKKAFVAKDVALSVNVAYEDVVWEAGAEHSEDPKTEQYYENLDDITMITKSSHQQPDNEAVAACNTTDPNASEHISMEETMCNA